MRGRKLVKWDLKEIILNLTEAFEDIREVYLFGSRAYRTNSYRSDIDLMILTNRVIPAVLIFEWITNNYKAIDIFKTIDNKDAESAANGSAIHSTENLVKELKAIQLWTKENGFSTEFNNWIQETREGVEFKQTVAYIPYNLNEAIKDFDNFIFENGFPHTNLGIDWEIIGNRLSNKIEIAIDFLNGWNGKSGSFNKVELTNEKDFQNLTELIIKPWLPDTERENVVAKFDGQEKKIDFSIEYNRILIEAKHIKDANTQAKVVKEIEGIKKLYLSNSNVKLLLFWVLVEENHQLDYPLFEKSFTGRNDNTIVLTKLFRNKLKKADT